MFYQQSIWRRNKENNFIYNIIIDSRNKYIQGGEKSETRKLQDFDEKNWRSLKQMEKKSLNHGSGELTFLKCPYYPNPSM